MLYLVFSKLFFSKKIRSPAVLQIEYRKKDIIKELARIAIPITLSSAVISTTRIIDLVMILRRLQSIGYTEEAANAIYGSYSTLAVSMFNLPTSFVTPVALSLVPVLTAAIGAKNANKEKVTLNSALRLCGIMMIPAALGLSAFSRPILELVFSGETGAVNIAAPLLSVLAVSVFFSCLMTVTNAVLQAYGHERKPIVSMLTGAVVKVILSYVLIGIPKINIYGAPISTLVCDVTVAAINVYYIRRVTGHMESATSLFGRAFAAGVVSVGGVWAAYYGLVKFNVLSPSGLLTAATIILAAMLYVLCAIRFGAVSEEDILLFPKGDRIYSTIKKVKLMK